MKKIGLIVSVVLLMISLSACGGFIRSEVEVFHQLGQTSRPVRFAFLPLTDQENSLEYKTYADLVSQQLRKYQYTHITNEEPADGQFPDVIVIFDYAVDSGRQVLSSVPIFGQTGVSSSTTRGTINTYGNTATYSGTTTYTPTYGVVGSSTVSRRKYTRVLLLRMVEAKSLGTEKVNVLYQASVGSSGSSSQMSKVVPAMIKALFKYFPGKSGSTWSDVSRAD